MFKLLTFPGYDQTGPHIFPIEADVERTIGHIKMARQLPSQIESYIRDAKPIPGKTQLLIDAMGAGEYYGSNSNGDFFPEESLAHKGADYGYETFMHYAYPFRHHCFPAGTPIVMADGTRKPIDEIGRGESVKTLSGNRSVTDTMVREYNGKAVSLSLAGVSTDLVATEDHEVFVYRRESIHCPHHFSYLAKSFRCEYRDCISKSTRLGEPDWVSISTVLPGDYLVFPRPKHGERDIDKSFAELIGWVASEGNISSSGTIQFSFSDENTADIEAVISCLKSNGLNPGTTPRPQYGLMQIYACSKDLSSRLHEYITGVLSVKSLTPKIMELSEESLLRVLGSYIDGDGHIASKGKNYGQLRIRSSSNQMLLVLSDIIRSLGIPTAVNTDAPAGTMVSPTNGLEYNTSASGCVAVQRTFSRFIAKYSRKKVSDVKCRSPRVEQTDSLFLVRVRDAHDIELKESVYNLEVEDVHHYIANEVVVHNCNKDPSKAYGDKVRLAAYDTYMHRVLLIIVVDDLKCQDLLSDIGNNNYPSVSMGCRVPVDECSICHRKAKNRSEYCAHLRYQMNKILPDGRRVFAYNRRPKFFDISFVTIGAEKASHVLSKVANIRGMSGLRSSAELGELHYGKEASRKVAQIKNADIDKEVTSQPPASIQGATPEDKAKIVSFMDNAGAIKPCEKSIPSSVLDRMSERPLNSIFSTLTAMGISLKPEEFQRIILVKQGAKKLADKLASQRIVFDERDFTSEVPSWSHGFGRFGNRGISEKIAMMVSPYMADRSCYPEPLLARLKKMAAVDGYDRDSQWYSMTSEEKRKSSGIHGIGPMSAALATGFLVFRRAFPALIAKSPTPVKLLAANPWLLPVLVGAGVGASVGVSVMNEPMPLTAYGTGRGLDGKNTGAYHRAKTASAVHISALPLAYITAGNNQRQWPQLDRIKIASSVVSMRPELFPSGIFRKESCHETEMMKVGSFRFDREIIQAAQRAAMTKENQYAYTR